MSLSFAATALGTILFARSTYAHGIATAVVKDDGTYFKGYNPSYQWENPEPVVVQWAMPNNLQNGFIAPQDFADPDIVCHLNAKQAGLAIPVKGGDVLNIMWNDWPTSHVGPIIDMLAKCDGSCSNADKTQLKFFKISELAVIDKEANIWAPNLFIDNGFNWQVTVPRDVASGDYVLRHEIIALHAAGGLNGAQAYPMCFNLAIENGAEGTLEPEGVPATELYKATDPGVLYDLYGWPRKEYIIPGPPMYPGSNVAIVNQGKPPAVVATGTGVEAYGATPAPAVRPRAAQPAPAPAVPTMGRAFRG